MWRQTPLDLTEDSHTQHKRATKSLESFWVQNPKSTKEAHSSFSKKAYKNVLGFTLYIGVFYLKPNMFK